MIHRIAFVLCLAASTPAQAWWEYGHETVATIAMTRLTPRARAEVAALLRHSRALDTPTCPARTIEQASIWPDCIKALKERFSYAGSWHYQNVDICKPFDLTLPCKEGNCVSAQIARNAKLVGDRSLPPRERLMALAFLVHFVGDLHMPLHAGDRGDLGGNRQKAAYGIAAGSRLNLHAVWDGYLAERAISTPPAGAAGIARASTIGLADGSVEDWSRESWAVARDTVYASALGDPCGPASPRAGMNDATIERLIPVVRLQILRGGVRLARLIDEAFAGHTTRIGKSRANGG